MTVLLEVLLFNSVQRQDAQFFPLSSRRTVGVDDDAHDGPVHIDGIFEPLHILEEEDVVQFLGVFDVVVGAVLWMLLLLVKGGLLQQHFDNVLGDNEEKAEAVLVGTGLVVRQCHVVHDSCCSCCGVDLGKSRPRRHGRGMLGVKVFGAIVAYFGLGRYTASAQGAGGV